MENNKFPLTLHSVRLRRALSEKHGLELNANHLREIENSYVKKDLEHLSDMCYYRFINWFFFLIVTGIAYFTEGSFWLKFYLTLLTIYNAIHFSFEVQRYKKRKRSSEVKKTTEKHGME